MYCCTGFRNFLSCAGERGHAILAYQLSPKNVKFFLQSRGLAFGDERQWKPVAVDVMINISAEIGIQYCPFCGQHLDELVQKDLNFFETLANSHAKFLASMPNL
jgi:hypothetical protein